VGRECESVEGRKKSRGKREGEEGLLLVTEVKSFWIDRKKGEYLGRLSYWHVEGEGEGGGERKKGIPGAR